MGDLPTALEPVGSASAISENLELPTSTLTAGRYDDRDGKPQQPDISQVSQSTHQQFHPQQSGAQMRSEPLNMSSVSAALPDISYQNYGHAPFQRYLHDQSPPALVYQMHPQYVAQTAPNQLHTNTPYHMPYTPQYHGMYPPGNAQQAQHLPSSGHTGNHFYQPHMMPQPQPQSNSSYYVHSPNFGPHGQGYLSNHLAAQFGPRGSFNRNSGNSLPQTRTDDYVSQSPGTAVAGPASSTAATQSQPSVVRGPPRKPRKSGHAIWIGNLPPQTDLMNLVYHVCKEISGLESLFLISKSNCAFANFKDEAACAAAQAKIHDSRFQSVRLVSRLRRVSVAPAENSPVPTGGAALSPTQVPIAATPSPSTSSDGKRRIVSSSVDSEDKLGAEESSPPKDKFFVVKSLTVEDLELSVRNGIWATQSHNEETLNKAYQTAENVYLIFSANKSGEYFGYAQMISPINNDPAVAIEFAPKAQPTEDPELPKAIPTLETEFAPKGRIIDDSARGTIFWEADRDDAEAGEDEDEAHSNKSDQEPDPGESKAWGKPFKVEWLSTTRLPFYRTRGLRNPWNSNREVKIARDGTELETSVGRKLIGLFHRLPSPVAPSMTQMPMGSMQMMSGSGYPQMWSF